MGGLIKKLIIIILLFTVSTAFALPNPAAVYCQNLGYAYNIVKTPQGEYGECIFSATEKCDEWQFLSGKCGKSFSYCVKNGYDIKTVSDGKNPYSLEYAVCVPKTGGKEIAVTDFITLNNDVYISETTTGNYTTQASASTVSSASLPSYFDWRKKDGYNWMTPVKDQEGCGSCWIFAPIGVIEAKIKIENNSPSLNPDLSEEDILSCADIGNCGGGGGNGPGYVLASIKVYGVVDEACFPYTTNYSYIPPCSNRCSNWQSRLTKIDFYGPFAAGQDLKTFLVERGPILGLMAMDGYFDSNGIYKCNGSPPIDHAIVIVGYNDTGGYWTIKNSWGSTWNGDGYFKLYYGTCSIRPNHYVYYNMSNMPQVPPVTDLTFVSSTTNTITLAWTTVNIARNYQLSCLTVPVTESNFVEKDLVNVPLNTPPGTRVQRTIGGSYAGIQPGTTYYCAVRARALDYRDSNISNVVSGTTLVVPTILNQSITQSSGTSYAGVKPTFICGYYDGNNATITEATVNVAIDSNVYSAVYSSATGDYRFSGLTLDAGDYTWHCSASKTGYQVQTGSPQTYIVKSTTRTPKPPPGDGRCYGQNCILAEAPNTPTYEGGVLTFIILFAAVSVLGYIFLRAVARESGKR